MLSYAIFILSFFIESFLASGSSTVRFLRSCLVLYCPMLCHSVLSYPTRIKSFPILCSLVLSYLILCNADPSYPMLSYRLFMSYPMFFCLYLCCPSHVLLYHMLLYSMLFCPILSNDVLFVPMTCPVLMTILSNYVCLSVWFIHSTI